MSVYANVAASRTGAIHLTSFSLSASRNLSLEPLAAVLHGGGGSQSPISPCFVVSGLLPLQLRRGGGPYTFLFSLIFFSVCYRRSNSPWELQHLRWITPGGAFFFVVVVVDGPFAVAVRVDARRQRRVSGWLPSSEFLSSFYFSVSSFFFSLSLLVFDAKKKKTKTQQAPMAEKVRVAFRQRCTALGPADVPYQAFFLRREALFFFPVQRCGI